MPLIIIIIIIIIIMCRRSAANAGSVMLRAEGRGSSTPDLFYIDR